MGQRVQLKIRQGEDLGRSRRIERGTQADRVRRREADDK